MNNGYLGDDAWQYFAKHFEGKWSEFNRKSEILDLVNNDVELAMVVSQISSDPEEWLSRNVAALRGKTPLWCLNNGRKNLLKTVLMSFPR